MSILKTHPEIALEWHPDKNDFKPCDVSSCCYKKVWWLCPVKCPYGCRHEYIQSVSSRTKRGYGCPYCAKSPKKICVHQSLLYKYPKIATNWHPDKNGNLKTSDVAPKSRKYVWWICKCCEFGCESEYNQQVFNRVKKGQIADYVKIAVNYLAITSL